MNNNYRKRRVKKQKTAGSKNPKSFPGLLQVRNRIFLEDSNQIQKTLND